MSDANTTLRTESPLNKKDPVREQIERDSVSTNPDSIYRITAVREEQIRFFKRGAHHQDPIAGKRCIDEVMKEIDLEVDNLMMSWKGSRAESLTKLKYRLEKLRR